MGVPGNMFGRFYVIFVFRPAKKLSCIEDDVLHSGTKISTGYKNTMITRKILAFPFYNPLTGLRNKGGFFTVFEGIATLLRY